MPNLIETEYEQTGKSTNTNHMGMREMQERAYGVRDQQYILLKAPPASGKSRALMFIALDKLHKQGVRKVIVTVPERAIGASFSQTNLSQYGFFVDWAFNEQYNLCTPGGDKSKVQAFINFIKNPGERILICTHATLRFAFEALDASDFNDCLLAIDEFHHVSADEDNKLGDLLKQIMAGSTAHIVAMTGSYFRGDNNAVLMPEDEAQFERVTYNYYEQLNGYEFLKSLGIGYHFYQGSYTSAINEVLDLDKKTIIHIPSVNSGESTKDKRNEVDFIIDSIGEIDHQDPDTGVLFIKRHDNGEILKVADLVDDTPRDRDRIVNYLRTLEQSSDMDIIIALGMAKEGFDWTFCEHALTVGYRGSLTEIIQIIGRCTRDAKGKTHAQFTNLIAEPDTDSDTVNISVNNMLKAITCSLLMEQVLAPNFKFKPKYPDDTTSPEPGTIHIRGFKPPSTKQVEDIIDADMHDIKARILQDPQVEKALAGNVEPEVMNNVLIPKILRTKYPDLSDKEIEEVRQHVVADSVIKKSEITESGSKKFITMAGRFVNIDELHIDLIDQINPFQKAFEVLSKQVNAKTFKLIQDHIESTRLQMSDEEAILLWPKVKEFVKTYGKEPNLNAADERERRMAEAIIYIKHQRKAAGIHNNG